ncbi:MAG: hypothetical protein WCO26_23610 [Deltaproteobacteria bacterium]
MMRSISIPFWAIGIVFVLISSCATVPTEPLAPGELRLLGLEMVGSAGLNLSVRVKVLIEADGKPEIRRACFTWSGDGLSCVKVSQVEYGSPESFSVWITPRHHGSLVLECYAEYFRDGKAWPTNKVSTQVTVSPF